MSYKFYDISYTRYFITVRVTSNWIYPPLFIHQTKFRIALLSRVSTPRWRRH